MRFSVVVAAVAILIAGCTGFPLPLASAPPAGCVPTRILFVGDSLMVQSADAIRAEFTADGYQNPLDFAAVGGSNAVSYGWIYSHPWFWPTPRDEMQYHIDTFHPDVVVAEWGMNPVDMLRGQYDWLMPYVVGQAMNDVKARVEAAGAKLLWTTIPVRQASDGYDGYVNGQVNDSLIPALGVPLVDWRTAVEPTEAPAFTQSLVYEDGSTHDVRWADGVHLTPDGAARIAKWTVNGLASEACKP